MRRGDRIGEFLARRSGNFRAKEGRLGEILKGTYGMLIFSDDIYRISEDVGLSEHDSCRLAKSAIKAPNESLESLHDIFLESASSNGFSRDESQTLWDLICTEGHMTFPLGPAISIALRMKSRDK